MGCALVWNLQFLAAVDGVAGETVEGLDFRVAGTVTSDGQLLFLLNNVSKMKKDTPLGSRIAEVHNGSSIFTGDAGGGESNARRFIIEHDLVEAIIAVPENMFYNTGIGTFIWILSIADRCHCTCHFAMVFIKMVKKK